MQLGKIAAFCGGSGMRYRMPCKELCFLQRLSPPDHSVIQCQCLCLVLWKNEQVYGNSLLNICNPGRKWEPEVYIKKSLDKSYMQSSVCKHRFWSLSLLSDSILWPKLTHSVCRTRCVSSRWMSFYRFFWMVKNFLILLQSWSNFHQDYIINPWLISSNIFVNIGCVTFFCI